MAKRRRKRKITRRFYIVVACLVAVVALVLVWAFKGPAEAAIAKDTLALEQGVNVVIVRDEKVYSATNYSAATFFATEGEKISKGSTVAQVYKWGFNQKLMTDLITAQENIRDAQENDIWREVVNSDLNEINNKISTKIKEIADVVQGNSTADIVSLERRLRELFEQKQTFLKQNVQADARLNELYQKEQQAQSVLGNWREEVTAEDTGVISFYLDGLESQLTPYNLETITKTDIQNAQKGVVTGTGSDSSTTKPLYRLINNYKWYCLIYVDNNSTIDELREGCEARMTFEGYLDRPYTAKVTSVRAPEGGGKLYVLEMSEDVTPLLSVRTANATLRVEYEGLSVPQDAIFMQDKQTMLKAEVNGTVSFVPVEVLISDDEKGTCIVQNLNADVPLDVNTKIYLR